MKSAFTPFMALTAVLLALAKARPGQLNFAFSGLGSSNQMAGVNKVIKATGIKPL